MNYIVIDLEWNQSSGGRDTREKNFPFEIIEIGAIKLDENRVEISRFDKLIKPQVYKEIHFKTKEIIHLDLEELEQGELFANVIHEFFKWCGTQEYRFCTWGTSDLTELQRNMEHYKVNGYMDKPVPYYDVQKLFSLNYEGKKNPKSLEYAVDYLEIEKKEEFHRAIYDAEYTAAIFKLLDMDIIKEYYSIDYYHHPVKKEEEIYVIYEKYSKLISREFDTKEKALQDKDIKSTICYKCGKKVAKKVRWFTNNYKNYYCLAYCRQHGFLKGKIRIKKGNNGKVFVVKTIKLINEEDAKDIRTQKEEIRLKRIEKKSRKENLEKEV